MSPSAPSTSRDELESMLRTSFVEGVDWPPDPASMAALSDMGMTVEHIARCFLVEPSEVRRLMESHGAAARKGASFSKR